LPAMQETPSRASLAFTMSVWSKCRQRGPVAGRG
jgi:hypothetical protein